MLCTPSAVCPVTGLMHAATQALAVADLLLGVAKRLSARMHGQVNACQPGQHARHGDRQRFRPDISAALAMNPLSPATVGAVHCRERLSPFRFRARNAYCTRWRRMSLPRTSWPWPM